MGISDSWPCADVPARGTDIEEILNGMLGPPTWFRFIMVISSLLSTDLPPNAATPVLLWVSVRQDVIIFSRGPMNQLKPDVHWSRLYSPIL